MFTVDRIIVQCDWEDVLTEDKGESFWVQYKHSAEPAINGKLAFKSQSDDNDNQPPNAFQIQRVSKEKKRLDVSYGAGQRTQRLVAAVFKFAPHVNEKTQKRQPVLCVDVSASGGLGCSSSSDGSLLIWLTENGQTRRVLSGHVNDVNVCKFFPSGVVVFSGGVDMRLKIWSAENGSCPVTLVGHTAAINDVAFVERGKCVVSAGRDGQCKVFNVGESRCVATLAKCSCVINQCVVQQINNAAVWQQLGHQQESTSISGEPDFVGKLVACACDDGFVRLVALETNKQVYLAEFNCQSPVNCCSFVNETTLVCGTESGFLFVFDLIDKSRNKSWKEFRSSVLSVSGSSGSSGCLNEPSLMQCFVATTADGSCFVHDLESARCLLELTGPDCDPVYRVACNHTHLFTCCRDGFIRKYDLAHMSD